MGQIIGTGGGGGGDVTSVAGKTGEVTLAKGDVGLGNVNNTSDADKPVSDAQQTALDGKLNLSGGTMTGKLNLAGASGDAGINIPTRSGDPTNVQNGDLWLTTIGLLARIAGVSRQLLYQSMVQDVTLNGVFAIPNQTLTTGSRAVTRDLGDARYVQSDTSPVAGSVRITNTIKVTQAMYDAIGTNDANTFYVIQG